VLRPGMERKLTAILYADVYGYSHLMEEDEEATLRTLSARRKIIDRCIASHRGRFVNSAGDSLLAEFAGVVETVNCAVEIQSALKPENRALPPERRMEFRIGVNLGDGRGRANLWRRRQCRSSASTTTSSKCHELLSAGRAAAEHANQHQLQTAARLRQRQH
jgi:hypothetical protein